MQIIFACLYMYIVDEMFSEENMSKALSDLKEVTGKLTIVNNNKIRWESLSMLKNLKSVCTRCSEKTDIHIRYDIRVCCL